MQISSLEQAEFLVGYLWCLIAYFSFKLSISIKVPLVMVSEFLTWFARRSFQIRKFTYLEPIVWWSIWNVWQVRLVCCAFLFITGPVRFIRFVDDLWRMAKLLNHTLVFYYLAHGFCMLMPSKCKLIWWNRFLLEHAIPITAAFGWQLPVFVLEIIRWPMERVSLRDHFFIFFVDSGIVLFVLWVVRVELGAS